MARQAARQASRRLDRPVTRTGFTPQKQSTAFAHLSAPTGGINASDPVSGMKPTDCVSLWNMIPYQYGLRVRSGYREWVNGAISYDANGNPMSGTSLGFPLGSSFGALLGEVRTLLAFSGSTSLKDKLFACDEYGIWDVTTQGYPPSLSYAFPIVGAKSGLGVCASFANTAGHFLAYCDEANGYIVYRETTQDWIKVAHADTATAWQSGTAYSAGDIVTSPLNGMNYVCTTAGTSIQKWIPNTSYVVGERVENYDQVYEATQGGPNATGVGNPGPSGLNNDGSLQSLFFSDGSCVWKWVGTAGIEGFGDNISDGEAGTAVVWDWQPSVSGVDPQTLRFVMSWKNRLWFCAENSSTAFYLPVNSFAGEVQPIYFGPRFRYGGALVGLWSWTLDGGQGIDDLIVGISAAGDVVIYKGSDPGAAASFALQGVWFVGAVPPGRRIASDFGGDLFILAIQGCVPLSKLVAGGLVRDPDLYATEKIANLFNTLMSDKLSLPGWALKIHPGDNTLLITVPVYVGSTKEQLTMSLATKGWARHRGVPMNCAESWHGKLYFGTTDGRVCVNDGYQDNVLLDGTSGTDIDWSLLTSYQNMGSALKKRVQTIRPHFITDGTIPGYETAARYDFDLSEIALSSVVAASTPGSWGLGVWGTALWGQNPPTEAQVRGAGFGMGTSVAFTLRGTSKANTTFVGLDVGVEQGSYL